MKKVKDKKRKSIMKINELVSGENQNVSVGDISYDSQRKKEIEKERKRKRRNNKGSGELSKDIEKALDEFSKQSGESSRLKISGRGKRGALSGNKVPL